MAEKPPVDERKSCIQCNGMRVETVSDGQGRKVEYRAGCCKGTGKATK